MASSSAERQNDDDESELMKEICRLRLLKNKLCDRLFKLKSKLCIPRPLSFKEYEQLVPLSTPVHTNRIEVQDLNLHARMYRMCGIQLTEANKNFLRAELTVISGDLYREGFFVEIKISNKEFQVGAYHVPIAIDMKELEKQKPLKTSSDISVFLRLLHRWLIAFFIREKQLKEFKDLCVSYNLEAEVFATHDMKYVEFNVPVKDFIDTNTDSLVNFCIEYNMDSLIPTNVSFMLKNMTEADSEALSDCVEYFIGAYLPTALVNVIQKKNIKDEISSSSNTVTNEQTMNHKAIGPTEEMILDPVSDQISIHKENKEKSSSSMDVSSITTSEVGKRDKSVKNREKGHKAHPIAESTPFVVPKKMKTSTHEKKNERETVSVKKSKQSSIRGFLDTRNKLEEMSLEENSLYLQKRNSKNKSNLYTENKTLPNVTNPRRAREVLSNSYRETPPVHFSKSKFKRKNL